MGMEEYGWMIVNILGWGVGGIILLMLARFGYQLITPFDAYKELLEDRNMAVGISKGMFMIAMGIILHGIVSGPSIAEAWWMDVVLTVGLLALGFLLLWGGRIVLVKFEPYDFNAEIHIKDNVAIGIIEGCYYVAFAIAIHAAL